MPYKNVSRVDSPQLPEVHVQPSVFSQVASLVSPIHRDGHKFIALGAAVTVILFLIWSPLGLLAAITTASIAFFFRDPERVTPVRAGLVVAPADGTVLKIGNEIPPPELGLSVEPMPCLSIFLSLFDVHVNRSPVEGRITTAVHRDGMHYHANASNAASENERHGFIIESANATQIGVVLVAGYVARRIVPLARTGDSIAAGDRIGLIRFGSRVDVYLPVGQHFSVAEGQKMIAGETIIADLNAPDVMGTFKRI